MSISPRRPLRVARPSVAIPLLALALAACGPSAEAKDRVAVANAIDELRALPAEDAAGRATLARNLRGLDVHDKDAIAARDACAKAYETLAEATRLTDVAKAGLDPKASADAKATLEALKRAEELRTESEAAMDACANASAAIRLKR